MLMFWSSVQQWHWAFAMNPVDFAEHVRCPVLDLNGGADPWVTAPEAQAIFNRLSGEKTFVSFPGIGHDAYYPHDPARWSAAVTQFLSRFQ
jgi:alpha-beta hydrolase superfamily lysophospholipase